jgi:hypothetical protein
MDDLSLTDYAKQLRADFVEEQKRRQEWEADWELRLGVTKETAAANPGFSDKGWMEFITRLHTDPKEEP